MDARTALIAPFSCGSANTMSLSSADAKPTPAGASTASNVSAIFPNARRRVASSLGVHCRYTYVQLSLAPTDLLRAGAEQYLSVLNPTEALCEIRKAFHEVLKPVDEPSSAIALRGEYLLDSIYSSLESARQIKCNS